MKYWVTKDGRYYSSEYNFNESDIQVTKRPNKKCVFVNGRWSCPPDKTAHIYDEQIPHIIREVPTEIHPCYNSQPIKNIEIEKKEGVILNENTKLLFGVKDILIIASFIVTATISWQDTDSRISKLEDSKAIEIVENKVKNLESDLKSLEKQLKDNQNKIEQNIRELEQIIFMKNSLKASESK